MYKPMSGIERGAAFIDSRIAKVGVAGGVESALREWPQKSMDSLTVRLLNGGDLEPEVIRWLWDGWLARGKLHVMAGAPGTGKTTIALALAATISTGGRFPDGARCEAGNVLIWSGEDDPKDTLLPRLLAMGADRKRIISCLTRTRRGNKSHSTPRSIFPRWQRRLSVSAVSS
jgi:hypothetical protein